MMHTEKTMNGKNWNIFSYTLFKLYPEKFELENYAYSGDKLKIKNTNIYIEILNDKFIITEEPKSQIEIKISQDTEGIDTDDRIEKLLSELKSRGLLS